MEKERSLTQYRGLRCLNCEHPLDKSDRYCPNCGQLNSIKKLAFDDFFTEFFAGIFAYDSRIRKTLATLLFKPGKISKDYIQGKRVVYANPFKFYLSASIIFFIIFSFSSNFEGFEKANEQQFEEMPEEDIEQLKKDLATVPLAASTINVDTIIKNQEEEANKTYKDYYLTQKEMDSLDFLTSLKKRLLLYNEFYEETKITRPLIALDSLDHNPGSYNKWCYKKTVDFNTIQSDPSIFVNYFISKLPFFIFFYLPVFALFIWMLYLWRPFNYMEHLIFAFHVQSTFFVMFGIAILIEYIIGTEGFKGFVILLFLFYLYKAMRKFYGEGRFKTIVKFMILNVIFFTLAIIAAAISLAASFAIF